MWCSLYLVFLCYRFPIFLAVSVKTCDTKTRGSVQLLPPGPKYPAAWSARPLEPWIKLWPVEKAFRLESSSYTVKPCKEWISPGIFSGRNLQTLSPVDFFCFLSSVTFSEKQSSSFSGWARSGSTCFSKTLMDAQWLEKSQNSCFTTCQVLVDPKFTGNTKSLILDGSSPWVSFSHFPTARSRKHRKAFGVASHAGAVRSGGKCK